MAASQTGLDRYDTVWGPNQQVPLLGSFESLSQEQP